MSEDNIPLNMQARSEAIWKAVDLFKHITRPDDGVSPERAADAVVAIAARIFNFTYEDK